MQGAKPKSLEQVKRIVRITHLEADEVGALAEQLGQSPHVFGESWRGLNFIIQNPDVVAFATLDGERIESLSLSSVNGKPPCTDLKVRKAFADGVKNGRTPRPIGPKDGILQVVYVEPKAQSQGIGGAHILAQLCAMRMHSCERGWSLFSMCQGRPGGTFWDQEWWKVLRQHGFWEAGPLGHDCLTEFPVCHEMFHAMAVEFGR
ncbi:MAG: hypothetical protein EBZ48_10325 [Proteobacteria bacterium]|nr:hypothetical protein [Pseudomonadota bacterium]